jgi:5-methyltetrahydrofolate--homocysteine methyltransferase
LRNRIDWTQFFRTWELAGRFPQILDDEIVGTEARSLYEDAQTMLDQIIKQKWLKARAVIGSYGRWYCCLSCCFRDGGYYKSAY